MTAKRRLLSNNEIRDAGDLALEIMSKALDRGLAIGGVDIRVDGVTIFPKTDLLHGGRFDDWKARKSSSDRSARRP